MKEKTKIYGINVYDYTGIEVSREYFLSKKERDDRASNVNGTTVDKFDFTLTDKTVYRLNNHVNGREKKKILQLTDEITDLKKKLNAKIKLIFN